MTDADAERDKGAGTSGTREADDSDSSLSLRLSSSPTFYEADGGVPIPRYWTLPDPLSRRPSQFSLDEREAIRDEFGVAGREAIDLSQFNVEQVAQRNPIFKRAWERTLTDKGGDHRRALWTIKSTLPHWQRTPYSTNRKSKRFKSQFSVSDRKIIARHVGSLKSITREGIFSLILKAANFRELFKDLVDGHIDKGLSERDAFMKAAGTLRKAVEFSKSRVDNSSDSDCDGDLEDASTPVGRCGPLDVAIIYRDFNGSASEITFHRVVFLCLRSSRFREAVRKIYSEYETRKVETPRLITGKVLKKLKGLLQRRDNEIPEASFREPWEEEEEEPPTLPLEVVMEETEDSAREVILEVVVKSAREEILEVVVEEENLLNLQSSSSNLGLDFEVLPNLVPSSPLSGLQSSSELGVGEKSKKTKVSSSPLAGLRSSSSSNLPGFSAMGLADMDPSELDESF